MCGEINKQLLENEIIVESESSLDNAITDYFKSKNLESIVLNHNEINVLNKLLDNVSDNANPLHNYSVDLKLLSTRETHSLSSKYYLTRVFQDIFGVIMEVKSSVIYIDKKNKKIVFNPSHLNRIIENNK